MEIISIKKNIKNSNIVYQKVYFSEVIFFDKMYTKVDYKIILIHKDSVK